MAGSKSCSTTQTLRALPTGRDVAGAWPVQDASGSVCCPYFAKDALEKAPVGGWVKGVGYPARWLIHAHEKRERLRD